jgi:hypothetical protein
MTFALQSSLTLFENFSSTSYLVYSIMERPIAVTEDEISRQGSCPTWAPVNPYTEFADIFRAN